MRWDFATRRPSFVRKEEAAGPLSVKDLARRTGEVGRPAESVPALPTAGEALHLLLPGRYDLTVAYSGESQTTRKPTGPSQKPAASFPR